jgi:hypothetical protein
MLADGARALPGDAWIAGQRVRFALDQSDTAQAMAAAVDCRADKWWCSALSGYVSWVRGRLAESDSTFLAALDQTPARMRCNWTDHAMLFRGEDRRQYTSLSCAGRDSLAERLWWLADPQYGDNVNERRAAHAARLVLYELRSATTFHERWEMRQSHSGLAMLEMLVRYGWPSIAIWGGAEEDRSHYGYLGISSEAVWNHGRFATAEYTQPRIHTVPALAAVLDPMTSEDFDWVLTEEAHRFSTRSLSMWWPVEHFERAAGPMVQLWSQRGLFRRQDSVLLAIAAAFPEEDFPGARDDTLRGDLFLATAPGTHRAVPQRAVVGRTNIMKSLVGSEPQLLSLELAGERPPGVLGRTRLGLTPPQPLSSLAPAEIAVSPPVFIMPAEPGDEDTDTPEAALSRMYTSTYFENVFSVGVYWETYGFAATDTAVLTVNFVRYEPPARGFLQRFLRGFREPKADVLARYEQVARARMVVEPGPVPIIGRVLTLDVSRLERGDYKAIVSASRPGGVAASGETMIHILSTRSGG